MATVAELLVKIGADVTTFQKSMRQMERQLGRLGDRMQAIGADLAASFGTMGAGIATGLGFAVDKAADFEAQMSRVGAIANASGADLQRLKDVALDLGASTSKSATEVAQGMENMAAMGFEVNEIIAAMPGVISAAEASGEDMAMVADTVAAALNAFGLEAFEATKVADVLAMSANTSAANIQDLSYTFKYAAPVAKTLGISLEELAAATGIMSDAGIRGEQAGTTLRAALLRLADPPREAATQLQALGVSITDAQGNMLPFDQIVSQLSTSLQGMGDAQKAAAISTIFGTEAASGMLAVIEAGPEKLRTLTTELENSSGASAKTAEQMKQNLKGAFEELSGSFETFQITIGNALTPAILAVSDALKGLIDWFNSLSPEMKNSIAITAAVAGGFLLLVGAVGGLIAFAGLVASGFSALAPVFGAVAGVISGPVLLAIGALVAAGVFLYQNWETISHYAKVIWGEIVKFITPIVGEIAGFIITRFTALKEWWMELWPDLKEAFANIWNAILAVIKPIFEAIKKTFETVWPYVKQIVLNAWEGMKGIIDGAIKIIQGIIKTFVSLFTGDWKGLWEGIKQILSGAWEIIKSVFSTSIKNVLLLIGGLVDGIRTFFTTLVENMFEFGKNIVQGLWDGISSLAGWIKDKVLDFVEGIGMTIKEFFGIASPAKLMIEYGGYIAEGLAIGIEKMKGLAIAQAQEMASGVISAVETAKAAIASLSAIGDDPWDAGGGSSGWGSPGWDHGGDHPDAPDWLFPDTGGTTTPGERPQDTKNKYKDKEGAYRTPVDDPIRRLPGLATGGTTITSGHVLVGEEGPEILRLPKAASVVPLNKRHLMDDDDGGGNTIIQNVTLSVNASEIKDVADLIRLFKGLKQTARAMGVT